MYDNNNEIEEVNQTCFIPRVYSVNFCFYTLIDLPFQKKFILHFLTTKERKKNNK